MEDFSGQRVFWHQLDKTFEGHVQSMLNGDIALVQDEKGEFVAKKLSELYPATEENETIARKNRSRAALRKKALALIDRDWRKAKSLQDHMDECQ
jgi:hypothetical protein